MSCIADIPDSWEDSIDTPVVVNQPIVADSWEDIDITTSIPAQPAVTESWDDETPAKEIETPAKDETPIQDKKDSVIIDNSSQWEETDPDAVEHIQRQQAKAAVEMKKQENQKEIFINSLSTTINPNSVPLSNITLVQPFTSVVMSAVGTVSKFSNMVANTKNDDLKAKYFELLTLEKEKKKIPKDKQMSKADIIRAQALLKKGDQVTNAPKLDDWQARALDAIRKDESIIVIGPTSGGKSYTIKYAITEIKERYGKSRRIVICLPTFPLALQTYADIHVSMDGMNACLLSEHMNVVHNDSWIYIGTPITLNNYFRTKNITYDIGIYDEIHAISVAHTTDVERCVATHELLSRCQHQVITLSATVSSVTTGGKTDITRLSEYLSQRTGITPIKQIVYTERVIPQKSYNYNGTDIVRTNGETVVTAQSMFNLLRLMRDRNMLPSLVFDMGNSKEMFTSFVNYLHVEDEREYRRFHHFVDSISSLIEEYNQQVYEKEDLDFKNVNLDKMKKEAKSTILKEYQKLTATRLMLSTTICSKILDVIHHIIDLVNSGKFVTQHPQPTMTCGNDLPLQKKMPANPTIELILLCEQYRVYHAASFEENSCSTLPMPLKTPYFRFGNNFSTVFNDIKNPGTCESKWQIRKMVLRMAEAEGLCNLHQMSKAEEKINDMLKKSEDEIKPTKKENFNRSEIDDYLQLVIDGLEFGVTCLIKKFPFVIQYQILQMLRMKQISVLFSEESMSMGINYPLRSTVIISKTFASYPVSNLLQMAGRSGRRGMDTESHVVYWNIQNSGQVDSAHIAPIQFPHSQGDVVFTDEDVWTFVNKTQYMERVEMLMEMIDIEDGEKEILLKIIENMKNKIFMEEFKTTYPMVERYIERFKNLIRRIHFMYAHTGRETFLSMLSDIYYNMRDIEYKMIKF